MSKPGIRRREGVEWAYQRPIRAAWSQVVKFWSAARQPEPLDRVLPDSQRLLSEEGLSRVRPAERAVV